MSDKHKRLAKALEAKGRNGDTVLAHLEPWEAALLDKVTDGGSVNPQTGLLEFFDSDTDNSDVSAADQMEGLGLGLSDDQSSGGSYGTMTEQEFNDMIDAIAAGNYGLENATTPGEISDSAWDDLASALGSSGWNDQDPENNYGPSPSTVQSMIDAALESRSHLEQYGMPDHFGPSSYVGYNGIGANQFSDVLSGGNLGNAIGYGMQEMGPGFGSVAGSVIGTALGGPVVGGLMSAAGRTAFGGTPQGGFGQMVGNALGSAAGPIGSAALGYAGAQAGDYVAANTAGKGQSVPDGLVGGPGNDDIASSASSELSVNDGPQTSSEPGVGFMPGGFGTFRPRRFKLGQFSGGVDLGNPDPVTLDGMTNPMALALSQYKGSQNG